MSMSVNARTIVIALVAASMTSKELSEKTGLSVPSVTGTLAGLKKIGFVTVEEGMVSVTETGKASVAVVAPVAVAISKASVARKIFNDMAGQARKDIIAKFKSEAQLTQAGAETYYYNFCKKAKKQ